MRVRKVPGTEPGTQRSLKNVTYYFYDGFSALCGRCCWLSKPRPPAPLPLLPVTPLGSPTPASLRSGSVGPARGHTLSSPKLISVTPSLLLMTGVVWGVCVGTRERTLLAASGKVSLLLRKALKPNTSCCLPLAESERRHCTLAATLKL